MGKDKAEPASHPTKIEDFSDYREFLKKMIKEERAYRPGATFEKFAESLELSSSSLKMILAGSRNLTVENIHKIATVLKMSYEHRNIFEKARECLEFCVTSSHCRR